MSKHLKLFVVDTYEKNGEEKKQYVQVGNVFPHKEGGGYSIVITKGISVSGDLVAFPPKEDDKPSS